MKCFGWVASAALLFASPVWAQDPVFSAKATEECLARGTHLETCIGASANACMDSVPGGSSTVGMSWCLSEELAYWDTRLNVAYQSQMAIKKKDDKENGAYGPSQADALRDMQRAWIPYRDARCEYVRSQWGGGTGGTPAALECHLTETAVQAVFLETGSNLN